MAGPVLGVSALDFEVFSSLDKGESFLASESKVYQSQNESTTMPCRRACDTTVGHNVGAVHEREVRRDSGLSIDYNCELWQEP